MSVHKRFLGGISMKNYKHFGELLEQLRISNNMTQQQVADGVCTIRQYSRLEKGESNPRIDVLYGLSNKFHTNLYEFYNIHFCHESFEAYQCISDFGEIIRANDFNSISKIIQHMHSLQEFETGENFQTLCYAESLQLFFVEKDYIKAIEKCYQGLGMASFYDLQKTNKESKVYSNIELCLLNCIACNYGAISEFDKANIIFLILIDSIDYQMTFLPFESKRNVKFSRIFYENIIYNLSINYLNNNELDKAKFYTEKGIAYCIKENNMRFLPELYKLKSFILINLDEKSEVKECMENALTLYKISNSINQYNELKAEYDNLFA